MEPPAVVRGELPLFTSILVLVTAQFRVHNAAFFAVFPQVTRVDGDKILPYRLDLVQILQLTLHLKCKQGYTLACNLLHHILRSLALIYPTEYCSVPGGFHQPISDYLPIKVKTLAELSTTDTAVELLSRFSKPVKDCWTGTATLL